MQHGKTTYHSLPLVLSDRVSGVGKGQAVFRSEGFFRSEQQKVPVRLWHLFRSARSSVFFLSSFFFFHSPLTQNRVLGLGPRGNWARMRAQMNLVSRARLTKYQRVPKVEFGRGRRVVLPTMLPLTWFGREVFLVQIVKSSAREIPQLRMACNEAHPTCNCCAMCDEPVVEFQQIWNFTRQPIQHQFGRICPSCAPHQWDVKRDHLNPILHERFLHPEHPDEPEIRLLVASPQPHPWTPCCRECAQKGGQH